VLAVYFSFFLSSPSSVAADAGNGYVELISPVFASCYCPSHA
jgi:hypothetical protein